MPRTPWKLAILASLLTVCFLPWSFARSRKTGSIPQGAKLTVLVYNYAHVPEGTLVGARRMAAGIFRQVGVDILWHDCRAVFPMDLRRASAAPPLGDENLALRIVQRFEYIPGIARQEKLGMSFGYMAIISFRAVGDETASGDVTPEEILGAAIAHELGHLLLGPDSHSERGIMRPHWKREDFARGPRGGMTFTPDQAQSIRQEVGRRMQRQAVEPVHAARQQLFSTAAQAELMRSEVSARTLEHDAADLASALGSN